MDKYYLTKFLEKVKIDIISQCWEWRGATNHQYYGTFYMPNSTQYAHRIAYIHWVGPIPEGLEIDHLCRNPSCVNPDHLEAVTSLVNTQRGVRSSGWATKMFCKNGHHKTIENTYQYKTKRLCKICTKLKANRRNIEFRKNNPEYLLIYSKQNKVKYQRKVNSNTNNS